MQTGRKLTLIIVRIALTVPKTALAGVTPESSFARFKAVTAASSEERATSRCFDRWGLVLSMVKIRSSCKKVARSVGCGEESGP